nr:hypothetical protein [uncultured organism]
MSCFSSRMIIGILRNVPGTPDGSGPVNCGQKHISYSNSSPRTRIRKGLRKFDSRRGGLTESNPCQYVRVPNASVGIFYHTVGMDNN